VIVTTSLCILRCGDAGRGWGINFPGRVVASPHYSSSAVWKVVKFPLRVLFFASLCRYPQRLGVASGVRAFPLKLVCCSTQPRPLDPSLAAMIERRGNVFMNSLRGVPWKGTSKSTRVSCFTPPPHLLSGQFFSAIRLRPTSPGRSTRIPGSLICLWFCSFSMGLTCLTCRSKHILCWHIYYLRKSPRTGESQPTP